LPVSPSAGKGTQENTRFAWPAAGTIFQCSVERSPRRSVTVRLLDTQSLLIRAPLKMPLQDIQVSLKRCERWLCGRLAKAQRLHNHPVNHSVNPDSLILYQGTCCRLQFATAPRQTKVQVHHQANTITLSFPHLAAMDRAEDELLRWLRQQADAVLLPRTRLWADRLQLQPAKVVLRDQSSRWGSCSSRRTISLNWRLIMAPLRIVDAIIIHELCHLAEMNHSARFWRLVHAQVPDYAACREWLADHGPLLHRLCPRPEKQPQRSNR